MEVINKIKRWIIAIPHLCISIWHILHVKSIPINVFFEEDNKGKLKHKNWGDDLNIHLLKYLTNKYVYVANKSLLHDKFILKNYSCIGSIIGMFGNSRTEIWGSGVACKDVILGNKPKKVYSVRGKYTRDFLLQNGIECPEIYGDPALLISKYYSAKPIGEFRLGLIPHYVDLDNKFIREFVANNKDVLLIDLTNYERWSDICDKIVSCDCIISSSLHGLIASDSYGIPNIWARFSNKIYGGDFKFIDYFSSVSRQENKPLEISGVEDLYILKEKAKGHKFSAKINYDVIMESCPFL